MHCMVAVRMDADDCVAISMVTDCIAIFIMMIMMMMMIMSDW